MNNTNTNEYNGWTNYETWRINLEMFDGHTAQDFGYKGDDPQELREWLKDYVENFIDESLNEDNNNNLVSGWANAFTREVNYTEIATHLLELED